MEPKSRALHVPSSINKTPNPKLAGISCHDPSIFTLSQNPKTQKDTTMNRNGSTRKRPPPTPQPPNPSPAVKHQAITPTVDEEFLDEDVFLDETLIAEDEENLNKERQVLTSRLSKWARPKLSDGYVSQSQSISE
jgi:hypothetical protein